MSLCIDLRSTFVCRTLPAREDSGWLFRVFLFLSLVSTQGIRTRENEQCNISDILYYRSSYVLHYVRVHIYAYMMAMGCTCVCS